MSGDRLLSTPPMKLPARDPRGHKGTFGTVVVVGGSAGNPRMIGAPAIAALAALRAGCGLAKVLAPEPILNHVLTLCPGATGWGVAVDERGRGDWVPHEASHGFDKLAAGAGGADAIVVGPGLGTGPGASRLALRAIQHEGCPVVLDADAINALATIADLHRDWRCGAVLTPHPGEFKRLAASLRIEADATSAATRPTAAEELAQKLGAIVVLKGAGTVVSDGHRTWVHGGGVHEVKGAEGLPQLATAGTGDVLAGLIGGLIAQHVRLGARTGQAESSASRAGHAETGAVDAAALRAMAIAKLKSRGLEVPAARASASAAGASAHAKPTTPDARATLDLFEAARAAVVIHADAAAQWASERGASGGMLATELAELLPIAVERQRA